MPDPTDKDKKEYQQPGVIKLTDEEITSESKTIPQQQEPDYSPEANLARAQERQSFRQGLFKNKQSVKFDPNTKIDDEFIKKFNENSPFTYTSLQQQKSNLNPKQKDPYALLHPAVRENLDDETKDLLVNKKKELDLINSKLFVEKSKTGAKVANKLRKGDIFKEEDKLEYESKSWLYPFLNTGKAALNLGMDIVNGVATIHDLAKGMQIAAITPGISDEEDARREQLEREIAEIEDPLIEEELKIKKSQHKKDIEPLEKLEKSREKNMIGLPKRRNNENLLFTDRHLITAIKDLYERTEEEYESKLENEGAWSGFTEEMPDSFNLFTYIALRELQDDKPEDLTLAQETFLKAFAEFEEVKGLQLNSNPYYRFFRDTFRPSVDFVGEIFALKGAGKALKTGGTLAKAGLKGATKSVGNVVVNSAFMPMTTTTALKNSLSYQIVKDEEGKDRVVTTDSSKISLINQLAAAKEINDYEIQSLLSNETELTEEGKLKLEYHQLNAQAIQSSINELTDRKGDLTKITPEDLRQREKSLMSEFGKSYYETGKELFAERIVGAKLDKLLPSFGNLAFLKKSDQFKKLWRGIDRTVITDRPAGIITKNLFGHKGVGKVIHSFPSEMGEELFVQAMPSFDVNYADQISEFANPDFYLNIGASVALMGGAMSVGAKGFQQVQMIRDPQYRKDVRKHQERLKDLRKYIRALDETMTDEDLAREVAMASLDSKFVNLDIDAKIANLRNPEKNVKGEDQAERNRKADLLEENKFVNAAIFAVESGTDAELIQALRNVAKRKNVSANTRKSVAKALDMVRDLKVVRNQNKGLFDGHVITHDATMAVINSKLKRDLDENKDIVNREIETLEAEFIEQSDTYDAKPLNVGPLTSENQTKADAYNKDFYNFLQKKGKEHLIPKRNELENISFSVGQRIDELNNEVRNKKSDKYQNKRKADKARSAKTKEEFDSHKDILPKKERKEREKLYNSKDPKKAVQDYNKKVDFKDEHTKTADADDKAFSDITNPDRKPKTEKPTEKRDRRKVDEFDLKKGSLIYDDVGNEFKIKAFSVGGEGMKQYLKAILVVSRESGKEQWINQSDRYTWLDMFVDPVADTQKTETKKTEDNTTQSVDSKEAKKAEIQKRRQEKLENKVKDLEAERGSLRSEDGSVPSENMSRWKELNKEIIDAKNQARRADTSNGIHISIKSKPKTTNEDPKILTGKDTETAEKIIEKIISDGISNGLTTEEIIQKIIRRYTFDNNAQQFLNNYISDRNSNAPEIGNNKQSFPAWRKGKYDAELKTLEEQETTETEPEGNRISSEEMEAAMKRQEEEVEDEEDYLSLSSRTVAPSDDNMDKTRILYNKVQGDSKKENPGVQDIVNYMVKVHGWDYVAKRYPYIMSAFANTGVDVSDAQDIYAKYDDVDNMFDNVVGEIEQKKEEAEVENTEEIEEEVEEKQEKTEGKKNTIIINGEVKKDNRTNATNNKFAVVNVEKKRYKDKNDKYTIFVDGDTLITNDLIDNHYVLDPDYVEKMAKDSKENPGSLTLRLFDLSDEIITKNNRQGNFKINLEVQVEGKSQQEWKLPIELQPGEAFTVGDLREKMDEAGFDEDVKQEFIAMYAPMYYKYKEDNVGYAHSYYWFLDEAESFNSTMTDTEKEVAREETRQLRRSVFYSEDGYIPVVIKGTGKMALNKMNDENGKDLRKKVSEAVGKVEGYSDPMIGKIGILQKTNKGIVVTFNQEKSIPVKNISDNIMGSEAFKDLREGNRFHPVQIFPSNIPEQPYRLNYLNDENQTQYSKIAKDSYYKVLMADVLLDDKTPDFVKEYLISKDLSVSQAKRILKAAGNLDNFYNAMGRTKSTGGRKSKIGSREAEGFKNLIKLSDNKENLAGKVLPDIYNTFLGQQFKTHYYYDGKVYNVPVFREDNFEFETIPYQEFLQEIYLSVNKAYTIKTKDGKDKTIFSINPQIYTDPYIGEETDIAESSSVTREELTNPDEREEDEDTRSSKQKLYDSLKEKGYDDDYINTVLERFSQDDELGSSRKVSQEQEQFFNDLKNNRIEGTTADQERIVSQNIVHNVALKISEGDLTDLGNKIISIVDENIDDLLKKKEEIYDIILETGATKYLETAKQDYELIQTVSNNRNKIYNKVIKSFNENIGSELEEVANDTDVQQWALELEDRHISTRLSERVKMSFYGIPKKSVRSGTVLQPYGLIEYHRPIDIFNKLKDIFTEIDPSWNSLISQLEAKKKKFKYPIYNDIINRLETLDSRLKNSMVHEMTSYKATYYKGDIKKADGDFHDVGILDINDTKKTITIVNNLQQNFKNLYGEPKGNELYINKTLVQGLLKGIENIDDMGYQEVKAFFDGMGFTEINENTWQHFKKEEKAAFDTFVGIAKMKLQDLNKVTGILKTKDNIFKDMGTQLRTLVNLESELNHSIVGSTKRDGDKNVPSTLTPMMVFDENRNFIQDETIERNKSIPFIAEGYVHKLLINDKLSDLLKEQLQRLGLPSLEVLKYKGKVVGSDPSFTKQGDFEHFVYEAMLYTSTMNDFKELNKLGLADYPSLKFKVRKLLGLTAADKKRTYIQPIPTLDLTNGIINTAGDIQYIEEVEEFLLDNLFNTQLKSIIKNYKNDKINNYTSKKYNKAFYHLIGLNTIEYNEMNIHEYLAENYNDITDSDIEALRQRALPFIKEHIRAEVKSKMDRFPEGYKLIDKKSLEEYEGDNIDAKYKRFLTEFAINTTLANMFSFQAYAGNFHHYGTINVNKVENKGDVKSWLEGYDKFEAKIHKRAAMLIAPGNVFAESKGKKISHIALNEVTKTSDQIIELIEQSYKYEDMTDDQITELNKLKNLVEKNKKLKNQKNITEEDAVQIKNNEIQIESIKEFFVEKGYFKGVIGYFDLESTDAQMYVTYKGYLDMLVKEGQIDEEQKNNYIKKIEDEGQLSEQEKADLGLINLQPRKLVYNGINYDNALQDNIPVYIKNSTFPLFPGLTATRDLDKLRQGMEKVERETGLPTFASYESANKIGHKDTRITMNDIYNSEGSIPFLESGYSELDYGSLRLQQATPSKEQKAFKEMQDAKQTLGSQMFKIALADGINRIEDKIFPNTFQTIDNKESMLSGPELDKIQFELYEKYNNQQKDKLEKELGVQDMDNFYQLDTKEQRKVIEKLRDILKNEVVKRNYPQALLDNLNNIVENEKNISFESPFLFDSNSYKFEALLQAVIANRVILHKLPGNSHIVGTSEGFKRLKVRGDSNLSEQEKSQMVFLNSEVANNGLKSNVIDSTGELQYAQVYIKSHFKYVNSNGEYVYVDFTDPKYYFIDQDGNKVINTDMIDEELMSQFSFRIPTSSHQSGALLEIAGFLPSDSQDLLIVPAEHTEQLGEDYDVDSRKVYKENYWVDSEGKVRLIRPENIDEIAEQNVENLNMYISQKEKMDILKEELGVATKEWKSYSEDMDVTYDMIANSDKFEYQELWESAFGNDIDKRNRLLTAALDAKDDQIDLAQEVNKAMASMEFVRQKGIELIKQNLEFKLLENDLINVYKSVYSANDSRVQNKINRALTTDVADASADVVYDKFRETSGQRQSDILSNDTQYRLLKGGADGSITIGISSKGVVSEAQAQRIGGVELKKIVETKEGVQVSERPVKLGGFRVSSAKIGEKLDTLDGKRDKFVVHTELQNVNLDNINKGVMAKINQNVHTMPMFEMAAHLGFNETKEVITLSDGKTEKHILLSFLLSSQPIVYDYVREKDKSSLTEEYRDDIDIINVILAKYGARKIESAKDIELESYLTEEYTEQEMYEAIGKPFDQMSQREKLTQLELFRTFVQLTDMAKQWTEIQNSYNFSTSKLGVSYFETLDKVEKLDKLAERHFKATNVDAESENTVALIGEVSSTSQPGYTKVGQYWWKPTTMEGLQAINSLAIANKVMPIFYPYQKEIFQTIMSRAKAVKGQDSDLTLKEKYDLMYNFIDAINAQSPIYDIYDGNIDDVRQRIFIDGDNNTSLGTYLENLKIMGHIVMQNPFMEDLSFDNKVARDVKRIIHTSNKDSGITPEEKTSAFLSLLENKEIIKDKQGEPILFNNEEVTYRDIALDLVTYQMLSDDKKGAISFKNVIPFELLQGAGITKYYRGVFNKVLNGFTDSGIDITNDVAENYIRQYYQHNPKKAKFVDTLPVEGEYQNPYVVKYDGSTPELYELEGTTYKQIDVLEGFDTFKQYDIKKAEKTDLMSKIKNNRQKKIITKSQKTLGEKVKVLDRFLKYDENSEVRDLQSLIGTLDRAKLSEQHRTALEVIKEHIGNDVRVEWLPISKMPKRRLGAYNRRTNTIKIADNLFSLIHNDPKFETNSLKDIKDIEREIVIEEMIHAITVTELHKHLSENGQVLNEGAPVFAQMLSDMYQTAKEALPQDNNTNSYYTSNIDEFVGGMFASKELHDNLEKELPGFVQRFKRALKNLFNYLMNKGNVTTAYKNEFYKAVDDMFKYRNNQQTQLPDIYTDRNINEGKDQRVKLKPKIKTQKPSSNDTQVYNENSIFGDNLSQDMIDNIIANEVTNTDENNNPC